MPSSAPSTLVASKMLFALSAGEGLLCGVLANNSQVFCWSSVYSGLDLVPSVCTIDCWNNIKGSSNSLTSVQGTGVFYDQSIGNLVFDKVVSGDEKITAQKWSEGCLSMHMPHGTLHDHLHSGLSSLNWSLRLKISMRAAKGLEYLHKEAEPPIAYHNVKTSNFLLDSAWGARIADFGLLSANEKDLGGDMKRCNTNIPSVLSNCYAATCSGDVFCGVKFIGEDRLKSPLLTKLLD
ncbi:hypothetical protein D5086_012879, partial [Populus alba]